MSYVLCRVFSSLSSFSSIMELYLNVCTARYLFTKTQRKFNADFWDQNMSVALLSNSLLYKSQLQQATCSPLTFSSVSETAMFNFGFSLTASKSGKCLNAESKGEPPFLFPFTLWSVFNCWFAMSETVYFPIYFS